MIQKGTKTLWAVACIDKIENNFVTIFGIKY